MPVTPRLVLDETRLTRNLTAMQRRVDGLGARLRPHAKTHKSAEIMRRQLALGACGATVATIREAEVMIGAGAEDVLLAFPPVGAERIAAIGRLARRARLTVTCSTEEHVLALEHHGALAYYWEVDVGAGRLGTAPGVATAERLARLAPRAPRLAGLMAFSGQSYGASSEKDRLAVQDSERNALAVTAEALRALRLDPGVLSVGSTPLSPIARTGVDEYRFGNYVFFDATQVALGIAAADDCAIWVEGVVLDRPAPDRVILDSGSKALAAERMSGATTGFGLVRGRPDIVVEQLYEEHAICRLTGDAPAPSIGDRLEVVPNHACPCVNLHAAYAVRHADGSESRWPLDARGWDADAYTDESEAQG